LSNSDYRPGKNWDKSDSIETTYSALPPLCRFISMYEKAVNLARKEKIRTSRLLFENLIDSAVWVNMYIFSCKINRYIEWKLHTEE